MTNIPPRHPIGDRFHGALFRHGETALLAPTPPEGADIIAEGELIIRYAIRYLEKPHLAIVPGLLAVDYGDMYNGESMWEFILTKSNAYPRADVIGYRSDGEEDMIVLKRLDLDQPFEVLAYSTEESAEPLSQVDAVIAPPDAEVAPRILEYLPHYHSLMDWEQRD